LEIEVQKQAEITVLRLRGPFRLGPAVESFRTTVEQVMKEGGPKVIVNLTEVNSLDSSGIGALVRSQTSAKQHGGAVKLVNPSKLVLQTLNFVGLLNVFEVHPDENSAIDSFHGNQGASGAQAKDPGAGWQG
jgi:anti-sigma B factor antagonist